MKKLIFIIGFIFLSFQLFSQEVPKFDGPSWRIAANAPDVAPYNLAGHNAADFTIYQSTDGKWHCVACIRYTSYPGSTRLFYRWEADSLTQVDWVGKGIFWTSGTAGAPDALGRQLGVNTPYTTEGKLQAPHTFKHNGKYYMFHNNDGAFCLISDDGRNWTQWKDYKNDGKFFDMGRDVMIFNDLDNTGKWYGCFLQNLNSNGDAFMAARTADSLKGPWSSTMINIHSKGNPESPFMMKRGSHYYLWEQMIVFDNDKPFDFNKDALTKMGTGPTSLFYAPEVIEHNGEYYIAGYHGGIHIRKFKWVPKTDPSLDAYAKNISIKEGTIYPKFDSINTHYYVTVPNSVTSLTFTHTLSNKGLSFNNFDHTNLPVGDKIVRVAINSSDKLTSRIYNFHVYRMPAGKVRLVVNDGSGGGDFAFNTAVPIVANDPPAGKFWDKWMGDLSFLTDPSSKSTTVNLTDSNLVISALYRDPAIAIVTVKRGTGTGTYTEGDSISIAASAAHADSVFLTWAGDVKYIANPTLANAKIYIPNKNIQIRATYRSKTEPVYALTVINGSGGGNYPAALKVPVNAKAAPTGKKFLKWKSKNVMLDDSLSSSTFLTMPASTIQIEAIYYNTAGQNKKTEYIKTQSANVLAWRSTDVVKPDDTDGDNAYGTSGYYMFAPSKKSLPSYFSTSQLGPSTALVTVGGNSFDDPALAIAGTVADYVPGKLDINIADGLEGEFIRFKLTKNASFRLGIISGHKTGENCDSVRVAIGTELSSSYIAISNTLPQITLFDISANSGDDVIIYGKTRTNGQVRNGITGVFFDNISNTRKIYFEIKTTGATPIQNVEVILTPYDTLKTDASGRVTFTDVVSPAVLKYSISAAGYKSQIDGVEVGAKDDTLKITLQPNVLTALNRDEESEIAINPNPVKNLLNISGVEKESIISIYTITGKLMIESSARDKMVQVNTEYLPAGLYVVRITNNEKVIMRKFIKE